MNWNASQLRVSQARSYDRALVVVRLLILLILSVPMGALVWIATPLYLILPLVAAVLISQQGSEKYVARAQEQVVAWLRLLVELYAYMYLLTDRLPGSREPDGVAWTVSASGTPTAGGTLLRAVLIVPHAILLCLLGWVAMVLIFLAGVLILTSGTYPQEVFGFLRGYLRWQSRVLVYLAGLTPSYPPFALDGESEAAGGATAAS